MLCLDEFGSHDLQPLPAQPLPTGGPHRDRLRQPLPAPDHQVLPPGRGPGRDQQRRDRPHPDQLLLNQQDRSPVHRTALLRRRRCRPRRPQRAGQRNDLPVPAARAQQCGPHPVATAREADSSTHSRRCGSSAIHAARRGTARRAPVEPTPARPACQEGGAAPTSPVHVPPAMRRSAPHTTTTPRTQRARPVRPAQPVRQGERCPMRC